MKYLIHFLFLFLLIGCGNSQQKNAQTDVPSDTMQVFPLADIKDRKIKTDNIKTLSEIASDVEYVVLKSRNDQGEEVLLGGNFHIKVSKDYIIALSKLQLYLFDRKGNYLCKIGSRGQGPGEYSYVHDFIIDEANRRIAVISSNGKLMFYDYQGKLLQSRKLPGEGRIMPLNDSICAISISNPYGFSKHKLVTVNIYTGDTICAFPNYAKFENKGRTLSVSSKFSTRFYNYKNAIYYNEDYNDTIFQLSGDGKTLLPKYFLDWGKYVSPVEDRMEALADVDKVIEICARYYQTLVQESRDYLFFKSATRNYGWGGRVDEFYCIYNKKENKMYSLSLNIELAKKRKNFVFGFENDLDGGPVVSFAGIGTDGTWGYEYYETNQFIDLINNCYPDDVKYPQKKKELIEMVNSLGEDDNAVVTIVKFK